MNDLPRIGVVLVTAPAGEVADRIARTLVERRLAACVNVIGGVRSHYRWDRELHLDDECLLIAKIRASRFEAVRSAVNELHPYDTAEVLLLPVEAGDARYSGWVLDETDAGSEPT